MLEKLKPTIVLTSICLIVALLLSGINMFTAPEIAKRQNAAANEALLEVLPGGTGFEKLESLEQLAAFPAVTDVWRANEGYVFKTVTKGYANGFTLMIGIDNEGKIVNTKCIASNETYGLEGSLNGSYNNATVDTVGKIIAAGATPNSLTSAAYYDGVLAALQAYGTLKGEAVDTRTPEQIFADNLNVALGTEGKKFTRWFATESISGVSAVYLTDSSEDGVVMLIGEALVGVKSGTAQLAVGAYDKTGATTSPTSDQRTAAEGAYAAYSASSLTEITVGVSGFKSNVLKVSKTDSGNYVIEMVTVGSYRTKGEHVYGGENTNIYFTVSITPDGRVIDVITTKQGESRNYGDACAKEYFYESIRGASREEILDLGFSTLVPEESDDYSVIIDQIPSTATGPAVIAGATFTTVYYQQALLDAFDVVIALEASN